MGARDRKKRAEVAKDRAPKFSFDEGLQVLTDTLAADLRDSLKLGTSVTRLTRKGKAWEVETKNGEEATTQLHSAVIYAGTAFKLAELNIESPVPVKLSPFSEIRYPPVASVVLGFRRQDVTHPCQGFGMLIPRVAGFKILGSIFSSSLFANRAPRGFITLTSYVGGERYPHLAVLTPQGLCDVVLADLKELLGVHGDPVYQHTAVYPRAIPQYNVGYGRFKDLMTAIEGQAPGFFLAGHYRDGVSLSDSIISGCKIAERVNEALGEMPDLPKTGPIVAA